MLTQPQSGGVLCGWSAGRAGDEGWIAATKKEVAAGTNAVTFASTIDVRTSATDDVAYKSQRERYYRIVRTTWLFGLAFLICCLAVLAHEKVPIALPTLPLAAAALLMFGVDGQDSVPVSIAKVVGSLGCVALAFVTILP